jgi:hypothetical protein
MIAAVTNFYNPANKQIKWENFLKFKKNLKNIPLYVIECTFEDQSFKTEKGPNVFHVRAKDYIWQQYRLINLVIKKLPEKYSKVVWIDADILFEDDNWFKVLDDMLDDFKIVQNYSSVELLHADGSVCEERRAVSAQAFDNLKNPEVKQFSSALNMAARFGTGFSWGVQREVIEKFTIYDYWITGSSDNAWVLGIWGDWENSFFETRLNSDMTKHYMNWAIDFNKYINQNVYFREGVIKHLWHGSRNYKKRWLCLKNFNPESDIKISEEGVFEWSCDKIDMINCCKKMCLNYDINMKI